MPFNKNLHKFKHVCVCNWFATFSTAWKQRFGDIFSDILSQHEALNYKAWSPLKEFLTLQAHLPDAKKPCLNAKKVVNH